MSLVRSYVSGNGADIDDVATFIESIGATTLATVCDALQPFKEVK